MYILNKNQNVKALKALRSFRYIKYNHYMRMISVQFPDKHLINIKTKLNFTHNSKFKSFGVSTYDLIDV